MSDFRILEDQRYISTLFTSLSKQKEVPIALHYNNHQVYARLTVAVKAKQTFAVVPDGDLPVAPEENVRISLFFKEIFFIFESEVSTVREGSFEIRTPNKVYASYRRLVNRYKPKNTEEASISQYGTERQFHLVDISTQGLAFIAEEQCFEDNETVRNMVIKFANSSEICLDTIVKHVTKRTDNKYFYGMAILSMEWNTYQKLFKYIFESSYPYFRLFETFSSDQIMKLYDEARFLHLKPRDSEDEHFLELIRDLDQVKDKPLIATNLVYQKNNKLIAVGSALRVYNRCFLGKPLVMMAQVRLNPKAKTDIYIGLADYLLGHPYFQNYLAYIDEDYEWHHEILTNAAQIVNDPKKLHYETLDCCEFKVDVHQAPLFSSGDKNQSSGYSCELLEKPDGDFERFCQEYLLQLEIEAYGLQPGPFNMEELSQVYQAYGFDMVRKLWRIRHKNATVGFALAECYSDVLSRTGNLDSCKLFIANDTGDNENIIKELLPQLSTFYGVRGKSGFSIVGRLNLTSNNALNIPGTKQKRIGRVIANREGLSEYKKLLLANFEYYSKYFPLTYPQKGIWYLEKMYPGTSIGNIAGTERIKEAVDYELLEKAINIFIAQNDGMRLGLVEDNGLPRQCVNDYQYYKPDFFDFSMSEVKELYKWEEEETSIPFCIKDSNLFYFAVLKFSDNEGGFYIKTHHLISDAWSMGILGSEIVGIYEKLKGGLDHSSKKSSYVEYLVSEEEYQYSDKFEKDRKFWNEKFVSVPELMSFKSRNTRLIHSKTIRKTFKIERNLAQNIRLFCSETKTSPFTLFLAILAIYLNRVTIKEDIVIGTPVLNRTNAKEKETVGMFVTQVPVRLKVDPTYEFASFIKQVTNEWQLLLKHQKYPYELVLKEFRDKHNIVDNLYDIYLSYQNIKFEKEHSIDYSTRWHFNGYQPESLTIHINDRDDQGIYILNFDFLIELFSEDEIDSFYRYYANILMDAMKYPAKKVMDLEMLSPSEKRQLLIDFNDTGREYYKGSTIHELFEVTASKIPHNTAVTFIMGSETETLSFGELNEKANRLARELRRLNVKPDSIVGIKTTHSPEMIIGIFGILKAGAAYLPIDPEYPSDRVQYMLENSGTNILLTNSTSDVFAGRIILLNNIELLDNDNRNLEIVNNPNDLAYVIYTSGSTGTPKGVMIEHRTVVNFIHGITETIEFRTGKSILALTTISFDIFFVETILPLIKGMKVVLLDDKNKYYGQLADIVESNNVSMIQATPSRMKILLETGEKNNWLGKIERLLIGGEPFSKSLLEKIKSSTQAKIFNMYGPTETTIWSTISELTKKNEIDIGTPIANTRIYIVDTFDHLQPIGFPGELCIGGDCLARGYLGNEDLTREKFVDNPFQPNQKMYRTGDIAMWLPEGNLLFLGRMDNQVKIRGFRIEPGEIEYHLLRHESVREAVVVGNHKDNETYLCAYVISDRTVNHLELRDYLLKSLPDYMVPSYFIQLDEMPLTPNGKINRKALPEPNFIHVGKELILPQNEIEKKLAGIWEKVLGVQRASVTENFFETGGDSLLAITLSLRISKEFNIELTVKDIFEKVTIRELALYIQQMDQCNQTSINLIAIKDSYPVSSAEKRIFILNRFENIGTAYNMPIVMTVNGYLDKDIIEDAFNQLIERHESLRSSFEFQSGQPVRKIRDEIEFHLSYLETEAKNLEDVIGRFIKPFNLEMAPLMRVQVVKTQDKQLLLIDLHHIIADGFSINILIEDLRAILKGEELPKLPVQYKDFAVWHNELLGSDSYEKQKEYWLNIFDGEIPVLNLPTDFPRTSSQSYSGDRVTAVFDQTLTSKLNSLAFDNQTTLFTVMLAGYYILLARYSSQDDIVIGSPVLGRNHVDVQSIVGMFANTIALRNFPLGELKFNDFLGKVKESVFNALENQNYPFEKLVEELNIPRDAGRNALFDTMFILQNYNVSEINLNVIQLKPYNFNHRIAKFDLSLLVFENKDQLVLEFEYCTKIFRQETIWRMVGHFENILNDLVQNPEQCLSKVEMLSMEEKEQILYGFSNTESPYPQNKTINQLFEEQVELCINKVALVYKESNITYKELNEKANQIAGFLRNLNVKPDTIIGIMIDRSFDMIICMLGVLKSGGAYLPIDPDYPDERIKYMLQDSKTEIVLTKSCFINRFDHAVKAVEIDKIPWEFLGKENLKRINAYKDLAYVIYTSGSTGKPKGVMIEHRALCNFIHGITERINFDSNKSILALTSISFDIFFLETFLPLLKGMKVCILDEEQRYSTEMEEIVKVNQIDMVQMTPSRMNVLLENKANWIGNIKEIMIGGEPFPESLLIKLQKYTTAKIYNMYGPTETTIWSTVKELTCETKINIGAPISNTQIYIINKYNQIQPVGIPGELCIGGDGVSRGYINKSTLTDEKFLDNPFYNNGKIYHTGDLARWLPNGEIEFLGRLDYQVKIRGYRIELDEIQTVLLGHRQIEDAIVNTWNGEKGNIHLCAYYISKVDIDSKDLKHYLTEKLPSYMVPSHFIRLLKMPVTPNGKINRQALPSPVDSEKFLSQPQSPRNDMEIFLSDLCRQAIGKQMGVFDDFFEIGGDSLSLMWIQTMLFSKGFRISFQHFYKYRTIAELSELLSCQDGVNKVDEDVSIFNHDIVKLGKMLKPSKKDMRDTILITGVTGFLGIHVLYQLLNNTNLKIYCLIRGKSEDQSEVKLTSVLDFYFDGQFKEHIGSRIFVINGDISITQFGLLTDKYNNLGKEIHSIIHCAALVKHFGEFEDFQKINVMGTKQVIEFASRFHCKLNYISTISVSGHGFTEQKRKEIHFTEDDFYFGQNYKNNEYVRSKFEAENEIYKAIQTGLDAKVFRVGNLTQRYKDGKFQLNYSENFFNSLIKSIMEIGFVPEYLLEEELELTPVDLCSEAVIKLAIDEQLSGIVFHIFNHNYIKLIDFIKLLNEMGFNIQTVDMSKDEYFKFIMSEKEQVAHFVIHHFNNYFQSGSNNVHVSSKITRDILSEYKFYWPEINYEYINKMFRIYVEQVV